MELEPEATLDPQPRQPAEPQATGGLHTDQRPGNRRPDKVVRLQQIPPECAGDYIYGWGPQTDPGGGSQANLQEDDLRR